MHINKIAIVCDIGKPDNDQEYVINQAANHLMELGFEVVDREYIPEEIMNQLRLGNSQKIENKENFFREFNEMKVNFIPQTLAHYTEKDNPKLYEKIKTVNESDICQILWDEYTKKLLSPEGIHLDIEYFCIARDSALKNQSHICEIFFKNILIIDQIHYKNIPNYHVIGRGFTCYGANHRITDKNGNMTDFNRINIPLVFVQNEELETQFLFVKEIINHEILGHMLNDLKDHYDVPTDKCIMSVEESLELTIKQAKKNAGVYLCKKCRDKIKNK